MRNVDLLINSKYFIENFFLLCCVFVTLCGLSLAVESRVYSLVAVQGLPIVVASPVEERRLQAPKALGGDSCSTWAP